MKQVNKKRAPNPRRRKRAAKPASTKRRRTRLLPPPWPGYVGWPFPLYDPEPRMHAKGVPCDCPFWLTCRVTLERYLAGERIGTAVGSIPWRPLR